MSAVLLCVMAGCARGVWLKPHTSPEETKQDYLECETLSTLQAPPYTLAEKRLANPDLSRVEIRKCMERKGYQWVP